MSRILPRSFLGQVALVLGIALLIAQLINFALILNEREKANLAQSQGPAIARFVAVAADFQQAAPEFRSAVLADASRHGARFSVDLGSDVQPTLERAASVEQRLHEALMDAGLRNSETRAAFTTELRRSRDGSSQPGRVLLLSGRQPDGSWLNAGLATAETDPLLALRLAGATLALYLIVLGSSLLVVRKLVRPLKDLTSEAERFNGRREPSSVNVRGPADLRQAIEAFNAMNLRVSTLLREKDVMLGAIGHDLRTPLTSLRLRVEDLEPAEERASAIATIESMEAMLNNILYFARTGRTQEKAIPTDLASFVDAIVEEYRDMGQAVTFGPTPPDRTVALIKANLLGRAIRNLIDNAVKYGHAAELSVEILAAQAVVTVRDHGPGIPEDHLGEIAQPFTRGEISRNSDEGGSGLGLAIAAAAAEAHGGALELRNGDSGGLVASIYLPRATKQGR